VQTSAPVHSSNFDKFPALPPSRKLVIFADQNVLWSIFTLIIISEMSSSSDKSWMLRHPLLPGLEEAGWGVLVRAGLEEEESR
jgi:hypothetical protein